MRSMLRLALTSAVVVALFRANAPLALTVLALLAVITFHEFGHFLVARRLRLHTPEFSVGFGPLLLQRRDQSRDMVWSLRAIPLGGYVRIHGMQDEEQLETTTESLVAPHAANTLPSHRSWRECSRAERALLAFAGPFANAVLSRLWVFSVILAAGVPDRSSTRVTTVAGSPAALAGVRDGDEIVSIAGEKVNRFTDVREILARVPNGQTEITVRRDGALLTANATPSRVEGRNVLGVQWAPSTSMPSPGHLFSATATATKELVIATANGIAGIAGAVASIPANLVSTRDDTAQGARLLSPIGAARVASDAAEESGWYAPLLLLAGSSMFVGAFNLLPIPPLDGGHILIAAYEAIASRIKRRNVEVSSEALAPFVRLVVSFIVVLGLSTILLDIIRPV